MLSSGFKRTRAQGAEQGETPTVPHDAAPDQLMHYPSTEEKPNLLILGQIEEPI